MCALATLWVAATVAARPPTPPAVLGPAAFHPVTLDESVTAEAPGLGADAAPNAAQRAAPGDLIADFAGPGPSFAARPNPSQPNTAKAANIGWSRPRLTGRHASGSATWYCQSGVSACHSAYAGGMYAAAGPALRVGAWRGRIVVVCGGGRCVNVKLIDWCACGGSHIIDLYSDAFRQLAPLSSGALAVTVRW